MWFKFLVTNACVALLSGLKVFITFLCILTSNNIIYSLITNIVHAMFQEFLTLRGAQSLPIDILSMIQSIFKVMRCTIFDNL